jgi:hypothetical protein
MKCESCSMPIESGPYCQYCVDSNGQLQPFEERFGKMVDWQLKRNPTAGRAQAEKDTLAFMSKMPAWKDNAELKRRL